MASVKAKLIPYIQNSPDLHAVDGALGPVGPQDGPEARGIDGQQLPDRRHVGGRIERRVAQPEGQPQGTAGRWGNQDTGNFSPIALLDGYEKKKKSELICLESKKK